MNTNKFFTLETESRKIFYQVPKQFMYKESKYFKMNSTTKLLYALLADRNSLSIENNWVDELGRIYFIFTQAELCEYLSIDPKTLRKYIKELESNGLLYRKRQGCNKPDLMYLLQLDYEEEFPLNQSNQLMGKNSLTDGENLPTLGGKITHQDEEKLPANKNNNNKTNNNTDIDINLSSISKYNNINTSDDIEKKIDRLNKITYYSFSRYECERLLSASFGNVNLIEYVYNNALQASKVAPIGNFMMYMIASIKNELQALEHEQERWR